MLLIDYLPALEFEQQFTRRGKVKKTKQVPIKPTLRRQILQNVVL